MIVIPMVGQSRRFAEAGYDRPKYMLPVGGRSMFAHSVGSFAGYAPTLPFLFVYRDVAGTDAFVRLEAETLGINDARFVCLDEMTAGQAETVSLGLLLSGADLDAPATIFNIDTVRPGFVFPRDPDTLSSDGYLEVFRGSGTNWSFVGPMANHPGRVARTTEKDPISDLCSTGLYHFAKARFLVEAFQAAQSEGDRARGEYYVAPLYNRLIRRGLDIRYHVIERREVIFSGIPEEYLEFCRFYHG